MIDFSKKVEVQKKEKVAQQQKRVSGELRPLRKKRSWGGKRSSYGRYKVKVRNIKTEAGINILESQNSWRMVRAGGSSSSKKEVLGQVYKLVVQKTGEVIEEGDIRKLVQTKAEAQRIIKRLEREKILIKVGEGKYEHQVHKVKVTKEDKKEMKKRIEEIQRRINMTEQEKVEEAKKIILKYLEGIPANMAEEEEVLVKLVNYRNRAVRALDELRWEGKIKRYWKKEGDIRINYYAMVRK